MSPGLWTKYLDAYVGGTPIVFTGPAAPTVDDCRKAGADYILVAPFDLRPRLPGVASATGRINAATHLVVTNCTTKTLALDQIVNFESLPATIVADADSTSPLESAWAGSVPATLAKYPLAFQRFPHIIDVHAPYAFVDVRASRSIHAGDAFSDFATADHKARAETIVLTVVKTYDTYVEVIFTQPGARPKNGDLVEPIAKGVSPAR